jgi:hypothetical protein
LAKNLVGKQFGKLFLKEEKGPLISKEEIKFP